MELPALPAITNNKLDNWMAKRRGSKFAHNGISVRTHHAPGTQDTADLLVSRNDGTTAEQLTAVMDVVGDVCGAAAGR